MLFQAMEEEVMEQFRMGKVSSMGVGYRNTVVNNIIEQDH